MEKEQSLRRFAAQGFWHLADRLDCPHIARSENGLPHTQRSEPREALEARASRCMFGGGHLERYVCPGCGCIYGPSKYLDLPAELVAADYALLYADYDEGDTTVNELRAFRSINPSAAGDI